MLTPHAIAQRYKAVQVKTCSPGELLVLLFEGARRFLGEAAAAVRTGERERAGERIGKAIAVLGELDCGLRPSEAPELCKNLRAVYGFCKTSLIQANMRQDPALIDDVARVLEPIAGAFTQVVRATTPAPATPDRPSLGA
jgi:flagellar secretion chaperone FliS